MTKLWEKWLVFNVNQLLRHMSVALATWLGTGVNNGQIDWGDLWAALVAGAIIPTVIAMCKKGIPASESDIENEEEVKTN